MKKHLHNSLRALFLSLAVLLSMPMLAFEVMIDGINYEINSETKQATVIAKSSGQYSGHIVIPESVEFKRTTHSVTSIGGSAFGYCTELVDVYCYAEEVPYTDSGAFRDSHPEYITLHVPAASIDSYKTTSPWSYFDEIVGLSGEEPEQPEQPEVEKCATPVVTYAEGKWFFCNLVEKDYSILYLGINQSFNNNPV